MTDGELYVHIGKLWETLTRAERYELFDLARQRSESRHAAHTAGKGGGPKR